MSCEFAFLLWLLVLVVLFFILRNYGITWWSSLVFGLIIAWIVLVLVYPFDISGGRYNMHYGDGLVGLITLVTVIIVIVYLIQQVFTDRDHHYHHQDHHHAKC
jgi:uncharacterized membrane protein